jgi:hypothetical protein
MPLSFDEGVSARWVIELRVVPVSVWAFSDGLPVWPAYAPEKHLTMELGKHIGSIPVAEPTKLEFFLEHLKRSE